jgi:hypothetical protein
MLKQVTELSAQLVEADRLIDDIDAMISSYRKGEMTNQVLVYDLNLLIRNYRKGNPSTVPDENWNNVEQEEKETLER